MRWWVAVVGLLAAVQMIEASRVLVLAPISSKSHKNFYMGIINAMADRGHHANRVNSKHADSWRFRIDDWFGPIFSSVKAIEPRSKHHASGHSNQFSKRIK
ncbi:hypothetical protein E2C01_023025 [Portunus trituberculatus]|uniref:Uncharacterized protein n=1 Tax=Portunus trituberculatus TaxID=210409 RepID=A0A5B7E958_PORTR|nr:hypothetical protein [Portunus trituberculatus]